uniref:endopeptidase La n=1 Tax=Agathobacter sp. TaxID=2021311 RepID=UPI004055D1B9
MNNTVTKMPAVALRGMTILPGMIAHFDISREKSTRAVEVSMMGEQEIFLVTQRDIKVDNPEIADLYEIGIVAEIKQVIKLQKGIIRILAEGKCRAKMEAFTDCSEYLETEVTCLEDEEEDYPEEVRLAMLGSIRDNFVRYAKINGKISPEALKHVESEQELEKLIYYVSNNFPIHFTDKQKILEADKITARYETLLGFLFREMDVLVIQKDFQTKVKQRIDKNQKDYILREQMGVIREELGETDSRSDADQYMAALQKLDAGEEVKERIRKEIVRFRGINSNSSESTVSRGYIETLLELPWNQMSEENNDLDHAEAVLDEDHYGLEKVKTRMLEFLAVRNLTRKGESPIICLVGPPGTGKTSIARSVARALNKEYVRICLGGVRDEAEIRGHRRTYVGAMPGRIVNGLRSAGVKNPLMLLDEIDKVSSDYKGDTSAALLEVLDSEQNSKFRDHYVEIPVDLSEVLFIATANDMQSIPKPLLDRMELIEVTSYTENEKFHIAKEYLLSKQMEKNGILPQQLAVSDKALTMVIRSYTKEAGVRGLERKLGEICRKCAREIYQNKRKKIRITESNLSKYLGKEKYSQDKKNDTDEVGLVRGLAWTSVGGVTLEIEVNIMPGKGELKLTGKMGDVMKESAAAGLSYIRSISPQYEIDKEFFAEHDIHIHIPEGAVPKDGPSAGITMATAVLSAIIQRPVRADIAMTGEITLRGRVLPIGGLKEKLLAAKNAEMKTVCIPKKNEKDLEEISAEIKKGLEIIPVEHLDEVLETAFVKG